jgi:hypothetical protein
MTLKLRLLDSLPVYGEMATAYPESFGKTGRQGTVVEFKTDKKSWVGNFKPGLYGLDRAEQHPNNRDGVVIAAGDLWVVDADTGSAECLLFAVYSAIPIADPGGWVFSRQDTALVRFGPEGIVWHTKRLSWDGFDQVQISGSNITGLAYDPGGDTWWPFKVDLRTGESVGGSYLLDDGDAWEQLASPHI